MIIASLYQLLLFVSFFYNSYAFAFFPENYDKLINILVVLCFCLGKTTMSVVMVILIHCSCYLFIFCRISSF